MAGNLRAGDGIVVARVDGVVTIAIDRAKRRNAINVATFASLRDTLGAIARSTEDRVVIITGSGGSFSSGGDLTPSDDAAASTGNAADRSRSVLRSPINEAALALHELPQPTIAAVDGVAAGAGANLAFGCDLVIAGETARFAELFVLRGLSLDFGGSWLLPRLIGMQQAKRLALTGEWINATRALELGLVTEVVPAGDVLPRAQELAREIAGHSPVALRHIKANLNESFGRTMGEALEAEADSQTSCAESDEFAALVEAFRSRKR